MSKQNKKFTKAQIKAQTQFVYQMEDINLTSSKRLVAALEVRSSPMSGPRLRKRANKVIVLLCSNPQLKALEV